MKSVGEAMAIGRTFAESLQKALRSLETGLTGLDEIEIEGLGKGDDHNAMRAAIGKPTPDRLLKVAQVDAPRHERRRSPRGDAASTRGSSSGSPRSSRSRTRCASFGLPDDADNLRMLKAAGFSDARLARARRTSTRPTSRKRARGARRRAGLQAHRHLRGRVRFADRLYVLDLRGAVRRRAGLRGAARRSASKVVILGGGPNRIGQGIEFDYCCCHASFALREAGYETIMINCNPETVSTDYDTSDRLYFEPLTAEDVLAILAKEREAGTLKGVIVQFGGQTPLKLARAIEQSGAPILGTSVDSIDLAEDRDRFKRLLDKLGLEAAEERHRLFGRTVAARRRRSRPAAGGAAFLRARRPGDGDHPRPGRVRRLPARRAAEPGAGRRQGALSQRQDRPDQHGAGQEPAAVRPLSLRRDRDRRRRALRRQGRVRRRHHGAHRGGGHPFRRQRLLAAAALAVAPRRSPSSRTRRASSRWRSTSAA